MKSVHLIDGYHKKIKIGYINLSSINYSTGSDYARIIVDVDKDKIDRFIIEILQRADPIRYEDEREFIYHDRFIVSDYVYLEIKKRLYLIYEFEYANLCSGNIRYIFYVYDPFYHIKNA